MSVHNPSSALSIGVYLLFFGGFIALTGYTSHASDERTKQVDQIFTACPLAKPVCSVLKTQNAKFAQITRVDFEVHSCTDGRRALRETSRRVILSTYEPMFVDMTDRLRGLAQQGGCSVQDGR